MHSGKQNTSGLFFGGKYCEPDCEGRRPGCSEGCERYLMAKARTELIREEQKKQSRISYQEERENWKMTRENGGKRR